MTTRFIGPLLCGGLLALALTTGARAEEFWYIPGTDTVRVQNNPNSGKGKKAERLTIQQALVGNNKKASKSNTAGDRTGGTGSGVGKASVQGGQGMDLPGRR
jgi:hypothetical protein